MANRSMPPSDAKRLATRFGLGGRMGRLAFLGWHLLLAVYVVVFYLLAAGAAALVGSKVVALLALVPVVWVSLALQVKRLHDMDYAGWHALWLWFLTTAASKAAGTDIETILRLAGYAVFAWLSLMPGSPSPNRFGAVSAQ